MARRPIVDLDETKCDGCGLCVPACAEGAIRIVDGKARLAGDVLCDGLGACLGECPRGAITIIEREAEPFDEAAVHARQHTPIETAGPTPPSFTGCPGAAMHDLQLNVLPAVGSGQQPMSDPSTEGEPALSHWPVQLRLVPSNAPFLRDADLFLVADCVPFACETFHRRILRRHPVVIGCPKFDNAQAYVDKLAEMLVASNLQSLTVVHMEVPCCTQLLRIAAEAMRIAGRQVLVHDMTVSIRGEILKG
jgi:Fe-S-cluster-containing hydrogenase component 2